MKKILIVAGLLVAAGIAYGLYEFNRTGKDTSKNLFEVKIAIDHSWQRKSMKN